MQCRVVWGGKCLKVGTKKTSFNCRFELYYYANFEFGKSEKPKETILTIDSRNGAKKDDSDKGFDPTVVKIPPLETAIHTK